MSQLGFHSLQIIDAHVDENEFNNNAYYKDIASNILGYKRCIEIDLNNRINGLNEEPGFHILNKAQDREAITNKTISNFSHSSKKAF